MPHERKEIQHVATHVIRVRDGSLARIQLAIVKKGADQGTGHFIVTSPIATEVQLPVDAKFKAEFIQGVRAALDEWEKT